MSFWTRSRLLVVAAGLVVGGLAAPAAALAEPVAPPLVSSAASGKTVPNGQPLQHFVARGETPSPSAVRPATAVPDTAPAECPPELAAQCRWLPAAYAQDDPADKSNYGNFDYANRPLGGSGTVNGPAVTTIVIHDTEGSLADTIAEFQNPLAYVSVQYIVDDATGQVIQMVRNKNVAWHAGNWYVNEHSIGIEHVGHAATGRTDYTLPMYQSSATLVRWLTALYHIPLDRQHIIGHDNVPAPTPGLTAGMHWDPGPFWNWQLYMSLLGAPVVPTAGLNSGLVTIAPNWLINRPSVTQCDAGGTNCAALPSQSANFVYLHTAPNDAAPLLPDPALQADGRGGTTRIDDWSAKATYGQQFAVASRQGDWVGIWYDGQVGWFQNPGSWLNALPSRGRFIQPKPGLAGIPVYGRAYPEAAAYNGTQVPVQSIVPLQYTIGAGQRYVTDGPVPVDYYYAWTIDSSLPDDHTVVTDHATVYLQIQYNHRVAYVKQSDVDVVG